MEIPIAAYLGDGTLTEREGNAGAVPPVNAYQCRDGWVYVIALADDMWAAACRAMERTDWLEDPRFKTRADRIRLKEEVESGVGAWCHERSVQEAVDAFTRESVPVSPVNDLPTAARDPHIAAREVLVEVPDPAAGKIHVAGKMIKFSRTEMVVGSAPTVGQHTDELLSGVLGYTQEQVEALREAEAI